MVWSASPRMSVAGALRKFVGVAAVTVAAAAALAGATSTSTEAKETKEATTLTERLVARPAAGLIERLVPAARDFGFLVDAFCLDTQVVPAQLQAAVGCGAVRAAVAAMQAANSGHHSTSNGHHSTTNDETATTNTGSGCLFCRIERGDLPADVVFHDSRFVAFHDRSPSARAHLLVIPRAHIPTIMNLSAADLPMLADMRRIGESLLDALNVPPNDRVFGFHVPPFNSVHHLHLHVIGKPFSNWLRAVKYPPPWVSFKWWIPLDRLVDSIEQGQASRPANQTWSWNWVKR